MQLELFDSQSPKRGLLYRLKYYVRLAQENSKPDPDHPLVKAFGVALSLPILMLIQVVAQKLALISPAFSSLAEGIRLGNLVLFMIIPCFVLYQLFQLTPIPLIFLGRRLYKQGARLSDQNS